MDERYNNVCNISYILVVVSYDRKNETKVNKKKKEKTNLVNRAEVHLILSGNIVQADIGHLLKHSNNNNYP